MIKDQARENVARHRRLQDNVAPKTPKQQRLEAEAKGAVLRRLQAVQREQAARDLVSEHQLYANSVSRMRYLEQMSLYSQTVPVTKANKMKAAKNKDASTGAKAYMPTITYNILEMVPFSFQGAPMVLLLLAGPVPSVKVFDAEDGFFDADFDFQNNVLDEFRAMDKGLREPLKQSKKPQPSLEPRMKKYMTKPEINFHKRKILRERGEYKPALPEYTPVHRADTYQLHGVSSKAHARSRPVLSLSSEGPWTQGHLQTAPRRQLGQSSRADPILDGFGTFDLAGSQDGRQLGQSSQERDWPENGIRDGSDALVRRAGSSRSAILNMRLREPEKNVIIEEEDQNEVTQQADQPSGTRQGPQSRLHVAKMASGAPASSELLGKSSVDKEEEQSEAEGLVQEWEDRAGADSPREAPQAQQDSNQVPEYGYASNKYRSALMAKPIKNARILDWREALDHDLWDDIEADNFANDGSNFSNKKMKRNLQRRQRRCSNLQATNPQAVDEEAEALDLPPEKVRTRLSKQAQLSSASLQLSLRQPGQSNQHSTANSARTHWNVDLKGVASHSIESLNRIQAKISEGQHHQSAKPKRGTIKSRQSSAQKPVEATEKVSKVASLLGTGLATQVAGAAALMPLRSEQLASGARIAAVFTPPAIPEVATLKVAKLKSQHRFMDHFTKAIIFKHNREVMKNRKASLASKGAQDLEDHKPHHVHKCHTERDEERRKKAGFDSRYDVPSTMNQWYPTLRQQREKHEKQLAIRRQQQERERYKREHCKKKQPYGILGLDPITVSEKDVLKQKVDTGDEDHAYGLDHRLFTPNNLKKEIEKKYNEAHEELDKISKIQQEELKEKRKQAKAMYRRDNPLMNGLAELVGAMQTRQGMEPRQSQAVAKSKVNADAEPVSAVPAEIRKEQAELMKVREDLVKEVQEKGKVIHRKMDHLAEKSEKWESWLVGQVQRLEDGRRVIDQLYDDEKKRIMTQQELRRLKTEQAAAQLNAKKKSSTEADNGRLGAGETFDADKSSFGRFASSAFQRPQQQAGAGDKDQRAGQQAAQDAGKKNASRVDDAGTKEAASQGPASSQPEQQALHQTQKLSRRRVPQEFKQTYPMCMGYYEPTNVAVFALVSKEIQLHQLKKTGLKRKFTHVQSLRVENMIIALSLEKHKISNDLMLCLGTQSKKMSKKKNGETAHFSEIVVYVLDPKLEYEVIKSYRWLWPEEHITSVFYRGGCGLIVASFQGFIQIYDAINVDHSVWDNGLALRQQRQANSTSRGEGSITTIAFSEELDLIAYGGAQGKIHILDQSTKSKKESVDAHPTEISLLQFFDKERQLISVCINGAISLWDAQKLTKIQQIRTTPGMNKTSITACCFFEPVGRLMLATTKIFKYDLETDEDLLIHNEQQSTLALDYLRQMATKFKASGELELQYAIEAEEQQAQQHQEQVPHPQKEQKNLQQSLQSGQRGHQKSLSTGQFQRRPIKELTKAEFLSTAFDDSSLQKRHPEHKEFNNGVTPIHQLSPLVGCIVDAKQQVIYTVDSDLLVRVWSIGTKRCVRSFLIETREDLIAEAHQRDINEERQTGQNLVLKKAYVVASDDERKHMVVAFEGGELQVNSMATGQLIYNNAECEPIKMEHEIAQVKFFVTQTRFWIAASCWEGAVGFITQPQMQHGRSYLQFKKCTSSHERDVITLDVNQANQLVTASADNVICFWDSFNAKESKNVRLPGDFGMQSQTIQYIRFPFKDKKDLLLIVMSSGQCYFLETQTERFLKAQQRQRPAGHRHPQAADGLRLGSPTDDDAELSSDDALDGSPGGPSQHTKNTPKRAPARQLGRAFDASVSKMSERSNNAEPYVHYILPQQSVVDLQEAFLVAAGEGGRGKLLAIKYTSPFAKDDARSLKNLPEAASRKRADVPARGGSLQISRQRTSAQQCPIELSELGEFRVTDPRTGEANEDNVLLQVELSVSLGIFLAAQQRGQVSIFSLEGCQRLAFLNEPMPRPMQELCLEEEETLGPVDEAPESTAWRLQLTTRRGGLNTHRPPNGEQMAGTGPLMATQRLGAPSAHADSNPALPKAQSNKFAFSRELSLPSNGQQPTAVPSTSAAVLSDKHASGSKYGSLLPPGSHSRQQSLNFQSERLSLGQK